MVGFKCLTRESATRRICVACSPDDCYPLSDGCCGPDCDPTNAWCSPECSPECSPHSNYCDPDCGPPDCSPDLYPHKR